MSPCNLFQMSDPRFVLDPQFTGESKAESSKGRTHHDGDLDGQVSGVEEAFDSMNKDEEAENDELVEGMLPEGFSGPGEKVVKPLTPEALEKFRAAQEKTGVVYISRIPPGMRPTKVRHLMSQHGEVGRVYLQPEGTPYPIPVSFSSDGE